MTFIRQYFLLFAKGVAMGAANVIPGVSGGTIAFITGIYDKLIESLKSFDLKAVKLLLTGKFPALFQHTHAGFLTVLLSGVFVGIVSFGKILKYLIELDNHAYEGYVWSFFFGLIIASVYQVGRTVEKWSASAILSFVVGALAALSMVFFKQATENEAIWYLFICGILAMASMLLPGVSGSFVLMLMGNYYLIMLDAVADRNLRILLTVAVGAVIGFILLSRIISFFLSKHKTNTISVLTGFVLGSLASIWPWKSIMRKVVTKADGTSKEVIEGFDNWHFPGLETADLICFACIAGGILLVAGIEIIASKLNKA